MILVTGVKSYLKIKLQEIRKYYPDWEYIEIGIEKDQVHLYMVIPLTPRFLHTKVRQPGKYPFTLTAEIIDFLEFRSAIGNLLADILLNT